MVNFLKDLINESNRTRRDAITEMENKRGIYGVLKGNTITYQDAHGTVRTIKVEDVK